MFKRILVLTGVALLTACSSSSPTPPAVTPPVITPPVVTPPAGEVSRAGAYIGDFGSGEGVYILSETNALSGLALSADGTAYSLFGNLGSGSTFTGSLESYYHGSSDPTTQGVFSAGEAGINGPTPAATEFNLNIVDGQTIESLSGAQVGLTAVAAGGLASSGPAAVAGDWSGSHRFCGLDGTNCSVLLTEISFTGTAVEGRTVIIATDGSEQFPNAISGSIAAVGDASTLQFTWNNSEYNGSIFFLPGSTTQLVFAGETANVEAGNRTIATLLTR